MSCDEALQNLFRNVTQISAAALDSFGKVPPGVLAGNMAWWGDYDECSTLSGLKYCLLNLNFNISSGVQPGLIVDYGVCVPAVCSEGDVINHVDQLTILIPGVPDTSESTVHCVDEKSYGAGFICFTIFCTILLLLMISGAALDVFQRHKRRRSSHEDEDVKLSSYKTYDSVGQSNGLIPHISQSDESKILSDENKPLLGNGITGSQFDGENSVEKGTDLKSLSDNSGVFHEFLLCFALNRNLRKLLDTRQSGKTIGCLNGIRVISITWVALGHVYIFGLSVGAENTRQMLGQMGNFTFQAVGNAFLSVDTFFFMSGLLVAYLSLQRMKEANGKLSILLFYFHRVWRLTPLYAFVILFGIYLYPYFGNGPVWYKASLQISDVCSKYWWQNLLYLNNLFPYQQRCLQWSWYLANDMQFYLITPLLLFPIYSIPILGLAITTGLLLVCFVVTGTLIGYYDLTTNIYGMIPSPLNEGKNFFEVVYVKPYCRIAPYLVGFLVGYLLFKQVTERRKIRLSPIIVAIGWTLASLVGIAVVYGTYTSFQAGLYEDAWTIEENIIYGMFSRFGWGLALTWVLVACHYGYGGWVNDFLSWSFWIPLSRLTYSAYLIHGFVINFYYQSLPAPLHASSVFFTYFFCGAVMLSYGAAVLFSLAIEYPFANLEKMLLHGKHGKNETRQSNSPSPASSVRVHEESRNNTSSSQKTSSPVIMPTI